MSQKNRKIIKKPIMTKDFSITIFLNFYKDKIKIDIKLSIITMFYFNYHIKHHEMRLSVLKEEIMSNVPKYKSDPNYLYIHIRNVDIFIKIINPNYSQPPLCFYQKIINENNFTNIFLLSNGHENPCVDTSLKLYPNIKFIHGSVE